MQITATYRVGFRVRSDGPNAAERSTDCLLSEGYSDFESLRKMIAIRLGIVPTDIDVESVVKVHEDDAGVGPRWDWEAETEAAAEADLSAREHRHDMWVHDTHH